MSDQAKCTRCADGQPCGDHPDFLAPVSSEPTQSGARSHEPVAVTRGDLANICDLIERDMRWDAIARIELLAAAPSPVPVSSPVEGGRAGDDEDSARIDKVTRYLPRCFECDSDDDMLLRPPMMKKDAEAWAAGHNALHHATPPVVSPEERRDGWEPTRNYLNVERCPETLGDAMRLIGRWTESEGGNSHETRQARADLFDAYETWCHLDRPETEYPEITDEQRAKFEAAAERGLATRRAEGRPS